jgi:predicted peroxiredoxin
MSMRIRLLEPLVICVTLLNFGCATTSATPNSQTAPATASAKAALLINVTSGKENLHAVSMGLNLAKTALEAGHEVVVFLNVAAPALATTTLGDDVKFGDFAPVSQLIRDIIAKGGKVIVCGHCAAVSNVAESTLLPGTTVAHHGELFGVLKPGMVTFSY